MTDTKRLLEQAQDRAPDAPFGLEEILARRARHERQRRLGGAVVGLGLTAAVVAGVIFAMASTGTGGADPGTMGGDGLSGTSPRIVTLDAGEFSYQRIRSDWCWYGPLVSGETAGIDCDGGHLLLESWWALDDSGRIEVLEARDYGIDREGRFGPGEFPDEGDLSEFPTEPAALEAFLLERSGSSGASPRPDVTPAPDVPLEEGQLWLAIRDFLGDTQYLNATPELRAAMLQVLADVPMVRVEAGATDPLGRPATVLLFHAYDADLEVFVEPGTGDFLAMTERFDDQNMGTVVVEAAGVTTSDHTTPEGDQQTVPSST